MQFPSPLWGPQCARLLCPADPDSGHSEWSALASRHIPQGTGAEAAPAPLSWEGGRWHLSCCPAPPAAVLASNCGHAVSSTSSPRTETPPCTAGRQLTCSHGHYSSQPRQQMDLIQGSREGLPPRKAPPASPLTNGRAEGEPSAQQAALQYSGYFCSYPASPGLRPARTSLLIVQLA